MSILVLNRFNPQYNPIKKWFRECPEDVILFVPMAYIDFYPKDCFTVVKYLKEQTKFQGIISTKPQMVKYAKSMVLTRYSP